MEQREWLTERFEEHRPHLRAVAYRMLGSVSDADDAVQEAWIRLDRADTEEVENLAGWLTTVVGRISLNMLRSRGTRREEALDEVRMPEPIIGPAEGLEPEHEALIADSVGIALMVVLESLSPPERLAFVLHDVFAVPFSEIAPMVDRTPEAARQLASRARRRVRGSAVVPDGELAAQREVVEAFFDAARAGDFKALAELLDPEVILRVDFGPGVRGMPGIARGPEEVTGRARLFSDATREICPASVNGGAGVLILDDGRPFTLMAFTVVRGKIAAIDALSDRERLAHLDLSALGIDPDP